MLAEASQISCTEEFMEGVIGIVVVASVVLTVISAFSTATVGSDGRRLQRKFGDMGNVQGMHLDEFIQKVGKPNSVSSMPDGKTLRQWMATGYHVALIFDEDDVCLGISSETSV